ncbi:hypothetical protein AGMMS49965_06620 [Bacteroidia bacterium]|nr:hypothetical protein AGMMS49965_06620 [Bacteroidia bacterium]
MKSERIEKLRNSPSIEINGREITPSDDLKEYRKNALEYGKSLRGEYTNKDTGNITKLSKTGLEEILHHDSFYKAHLQSIAAIPKLIENGIYIDTVENEDIEKHPKIKEYRYYVSGLKIGGVDYTVKAVIAIDKDENRYYDHALTQIEKSKLLAVVEGITSPARQQGVSEDKNTNKSISLSAYKDKRLISILQTNILQLFDKST